MDFDFSSFLTGMVAVLGVEAVVIWLFSVAENRAGRRLRVRPRAVHAERHGVQMG